MQPFGEILTPRGCGCGHQIPLRAAAWIPSKEHAENSEMCLFTFGLSMGSLNRKDWETADLIWLLMHKSVLFGAKANVSLGMVPESLASMLCAGQLYGQNWKHILKIRVFFFLLQWNILLVLVWREHNERFSEHRIKLWIFSIISKHGISK